MKNTTTAERPATTLPLENTAAAVPAEALAAAPKQLPPAPPEPAAPAPSLAGKLARVTAQVSRVPKRGWNDFNRYHYVMESDLLDAVRASLAAEGVALQSSVVSHKCERMPTQRGEQTMAVVMMRFTWHDAATGETLSSEFPGMAADSGIGDKAIYKAITGATKYFIMKTFLMSTGDDPENDGDHQKSKAASAPRGRGGPPREEAPPNDPGFENDPGFGPADHGEPASAAPVPTRPDIVIDSTEAKWLYNVMKVATGQDASAIRALLKRETAVETFAGVDDPRNVPVEQYAWLEAKYKALADRKKAS